MNIFGKNIHTDYHYRIPKKYTRRRSQLELKNWVASNAYNASNSQISVEVQRSWLQGTYVRWRLVFYPSQTCNWWLFVGIILFFHFYLVEAVLATFAYWLVASLYYFAIHQTIYTDNYVHRLDTHLQSLYCISNV